MHPITFCEEKPLTMDCGKCNHRSQTNGIAAFCKFYQRINLDDTFLNVTFNLLSVLWVILKGLSGHFSFSPSPPTPKKLLFKSPPSITPSPILHHTWFPPSITPSTTPDRPRWWCSPLAGAASAADGNGTLHASFEEMWSPLSSLSIKAAPSTSDGNGGEPHASSSECCRIWNHPFM